MKNRRLSGYSVNELWSLHEEISHLLSSKITEEKARLEEILRKLRRQVAATSAKRTYASVPPKFRNPANPSEIWSGRGKRPRWLSAALKKGTDLEEFRIGA
jgi:DNA-binding protein H-NS